MLGRIRAVREHRYYIHLDATGNSVPDTPAQIERYIREQRTDLFTHFDFTGLVPEYTDDGERTFHDGPYYRLWLANIAVVNRSKNDFVRSFVLRMRDSGAAVIHLTGDVFSDIFGVPMYIGEDLNPEIEDNWIEHRSARAAVRSMHHASIAAAADLPDAEIEDIRRAMDMQADVTSGQYDCMQRHILRTHYGYQGEITERFVKVYGEPATRRVFKNLKRIHGHRTVRDALDAIQLEERADHTRLMSLDGHEKYRDLARTYVFNQHRHALGILMVLGIESVTEMRTIHERELAERIYGSRAMLIDAIRQVCTILELPVPRGLNITAPNRDSVNSVMPAINKILKTMYGAKITLAQKQGQIWRYTPTTLFRDGNIAAH